MASPSTRPRSQPAGSVYCGLLSLCVAGGVLAAALAVSTEEQPAASSWLEPIRITILHTNDIHGRVLPGGDVETGLVALGRTIRQERDRARGRGEAVLLLDGGDMWKGSLTADLTDGEVLAAWMNHVGYDAAVLGNHEFDHGVEVAKRLVGLTEFPVLGANILDEATTRTAAWVGASARPGDVPGQVALRSIEQDGARIKVGIVGLTTRHTRRLTVDGATRGLTFADEAETLERILDSLPNLDLVVVLSHAGIETDRKLATRFQDRVHVIVGGHSHTTLPKGEQVDGVLICQAGDYARYLGRVQLRVNPPGVTPRVSAEASLIPAGDDLDDVLEPFVARAAEKGDQVVGQLVGNLKRSLRRSSSSALGNLQTELMRKATKADLAFQNKTGIRADLGVGRVLYRDIYAVSPFGNFPVAMTLTGKDVLELCENMLNEGTRFMLEVSGGQVTFDSSRPRGARLIEVRVAGKPIDPTKTYRVATNNYLASGKDTHAVFTRGTQRTSSSKRIRDLLREFLERNNPHDPPPIESRLIDRAR